MIVKALGVFDLLSAAIILLNMFDVVPSRFVISVGMYLLIKMVIFFGDALSMVDGLIALIVMVNLLYGVAWINYIILLYLVIKGGVSVL
jgi:hypothetical protein